jgi:hypothetical protein
MEISESFFGKNQGKLARWRNLAPKIIHYQQYGGVQNQDIYEDDDIIYEDAIKNATMTPLFDRKVGALHRQLLS